MKNLIPIFSSYACNILEEEFKYFLLSCQVRKLDDNKWEVGSQNHEILTVHQVHKIDDVLRCSCDFRNSRGIPCCHSIGVWSQSEMGIKPLNILPRWRKDYDVCIPLNNGENSPQEISFEKEEIKNPIIGTNPGRKPNKKRYLSRHEKYQISTRLPKSKSPSDVKYKNRVNENRDRIAKPSKKIKKV